jgi:hypothetical protein
MVNPTLNQSIMDESTQIQLKEKYMDGKKIFIVI